MDRIEKVVESAEERMFRKLGFELSEKLNAILGKGVKFELTVSDAPVSKVAFMQECNEKIRAMQGHQAYISEESKFIIRVDDGNLPF